MLRAHKVLGSKGIRSSVVIDSNVILDTFDQSSPNHEASLSFMESIVGNGILFAMPMHGWFEVTCTLNRMRCEGRDSPPVIAGSESMMVEFIHIDDQFLENYASVEVPVIKAMDHLFLVVAKKNNLPLVTWDKQTIAAGVQCGVKVLTPQEWILSKGSGQPSNSPDASGAR